MKDKVYIYGLVDPVSKEIRYVGKTVQSVENRLASHLSKAKTSKKKTHVYCWIKSLLTQNLKPDIVVLEEVDSKTWEESEKFFISYFKYIGADLTNNTEGGEAGTLGARWSLPIDKHSPKYTKKVYIFNPDREIVKVFDTIQEFRKTYQMPTSTWNGKILSDGLIASSKDTFPALSTRRFRPVSAIVGGAEVIFDSTRAFSDHTKCAFTTALYQLSKGSGSLIDTYQLRYTDSKTLQLLTNG